MNYSGDGQYVQMADDVSQASWQTEGYNTDYSIDKVRMEELELDEFFEE